MRITQSSTLAGGRDRRLARSQRCFELRRSDIAPFPLESPGPRRGRDSSAQVPLGTGTPPGTPSPRAPLLSWPSWSGKAWWEQARPLAGPSRYKSSSSGGWLPGALPRRGSPGWARLRAPPACRLSTLRESSARPCKKDEHHQEQNPTQTLAKAYLNWWCLFIFICI